jgi:hypothetical protein
VGDALYVGTDGDARLLTLSQGALVPLTGFDGTPGRSGWYAGTAIIDGREVGPPLGVRSLAATADGAVLLAAVHVGGIPRSTDGGAGWQPTMDVDHDVHEVCAHPARPGWVAAATAVGLCMSSDAGATWRAHTDGLHATYCSAVAFAGDDILVAASTGHFTSEGALYRGQVGADGVDGPLARMEMGDGPWLDGIVDTACLAARGDVVAAVTKSGTLYVSRTAGHRWSVQAAGLSAASSILIV